MSDYWWVILVVVALAGFLAYVFLHVGRTEGGESSD